MRFQRNGLFKIVVSFTSEKKKIYSGADLSFIVSEMYCLSRLTIGKPLQYANILRTSAANKVTMKIVPARIEEKEPYIERNERINRELSPHLSIYKIQLTSLLSISHRGCGVVLSGYSTLLGIGALVSPYDFSYYVTMIEGLSLSSPVLMATKFMIAFPFAYHFSNGIRHLCWDYGMFLKIKEVYKTGYVMIAATVVISAALALL